MTKNILAFIHNNHTTAILEEIHLPRGTKIKEIKNLKNYSGTSNDIILFGLTGNSEIRPEEEEQIQDVLKLHNKIHPTFVIITPFSFEDKVDLSYINQKLDILKEAQVDFEILELQDLVRKYRNYTFTQAFKEIQKVLELICKVKFNKFKG